MVSHLQPKLVSYDYSDLIWLTHFQQLVCMFECEAEDVNRDVEVDGNAQPGIALSNVT